MLRCDPADVLWSLRSFAANHPDRAMVLYRTMVWAVLQSELDPDYRLTPSSPGRFPPPGLRSPNGALHISPGQSEAPPWVLGTNNDMSPEGATPPSQK